MKNNKLIYILSGLVIMIATLFLISKVFLNDLFFDIKTGEDILKYGIDFKDHFSFIPNLIYIYHHWFYDVIIYFIYNSLGYHGIFFFFLLIYTIFGFILLYVNKKLTNSFWVSILVTLVTIYICGYAFQSRVQSITYLLFFLEVFFIDKLYNTGKFKYSIYIFLISILIANMHMPLWIFTLILYLPYIFEFIIKFIIDKSKRIKNIISDRLIIKYPCNKRLFITTFIILIFTGLLSPLKLYPYTFFLKSLGNKSYSFIGEMSKTVLIDWKEGLIFIILLFIILFLKNIKIKLRDLSLLIGLFLFALIVNRNFIYFYIFFPTIFVKILYESYNFLNINFKVFSKISKNIVAMFTIMFLTCSYSFLLYSLNLSSYDYNISAMYPVATVKYLKNNADYSNIKLYNDFNFGSFLEFNDIPVFIDSRAEVYIKEFNGGFDIVSDYLDTKKFSTYKSIFEKYKFDYALVYKASEIYYYLKYDTEFEIAFEEENYTLFKKTNSM